MLMKWWRAALAWLHGRDFDEGLPLIVIGAVIGVLTGLGVVGFYKLIDGSYAVLNQWPQQHIALLGQAVLRIAITAVGVWLAWFITHRGRYGEGQNVPDVQLAVARRGGIIRSRPVAVRTVASAITLGSGGSVGSEGPVAVLGSGVGSLFGRLLDMQPRHIKILVGCGAGAGIAGAFNAPFAGAFFALEEILGSFSIGAFSPVVIASVVGALTVRSFLGEHPAFHMPDYPDVHPVANALLYPILGVAAGAASALYSRLDTLVPQWMRRVPGPLWVRPILGGALVGGIVVASRGLLAGNGHLAIPAPVFGGIAWYLLIGLAIAKIVATVLTLGSGGSGGVFTPALFIGAALGGGVGKLLSDIVPGNLIHPQSWALVGMAGIVSGATRAPLTAIFIVYEMTNDSGYVIPLMIVSVVAFVTAKKLTPYGLYDGWLAARGQHIAHGVDQSILEELRVRDALDASAPRVLPTATLTEVTGLMGDAIAATASVVDADGRLVGVVGHHQLANALTQPLASRQLVIADDLAERLEPLRSDQSLREALASMNALNRDALPVISVNGDGHPTFIGLITRATALAAYDRMLDHAV